ncbi:BURP DOMAIN-CONTAINING PROTEIN-RELATED [Salix viminalis]|uniref:BURP DOMAIN-CONTAINING PROTEIN-RELATED n=1 Tax=Salix viminalis TaxID=40686 RepID=A0A9Q0ZQZ1_SALVM|nr:BURP DOMAIN-CONTAINING PROTEIN-RELATED [Salix viminalis]
MLFSLILDKRLKMEFHLPHTLAFLAFALVVSHAALPPELYWKSVLPNTPMPKSVRDLLHPDLVEDKSTSVAVGKGGVNVDAGKGKPGGTAVTVGKGGVNVDAGKGKPGGTAVAVGKGGVNVDAGKGKPGGGTSVNVGKGGVNVDAGKGKPGGGTSVNVGKGGVNVDAGKGKPGGGTSVNVGKGGVGVDAGKGKPGSGGTHVSVGGPGVGVDTGKPGKKTKVGVGKGGVSVNTGKKGKPVIVGVHPGPNPFNYIYAATETQLRDDPNVALFFLEKEMHPGKVMNLQFTENTDTATFLPRQVADSIPFSSDKLPEIYSEFSVKPGSMEAEEMENTIKECESPGIKGEEKYCATSLESMIDFTTSKLGKNVLAISTEVDGQTKMQKYTIKTGVKKMAGDKSVVCHKQNYAYAVFYCHATKSTRAYTVPLVGDDGTKAKAVAVCHTDTSAWNPKHLAFQVLNVKPGTVPVCHFLPQDHVVWVSNN